MKFGPVETRAAAGGLLAHRLRAGRLALHKGHALSEADCAALAAAGVPEVTVAHLEPGDMDENAAARCLGQAACGAGLRVERAFTGRVNLYAEHAGVFLPDAATVQALNALDSDITLATLPPFARVEAGEMVATVKIIPFAVAGELVTAGQGILARAPLTVKPFTSRRVALLLMSLPSLKPAVLRKTEAVTRERIEALGSSLVHCEQLEHSRAALDAALARLDGLAFDLLILFGAAAITDRRDIIPAAVEAAGGRIIRLGMPVDPGNLLLLAEWRGKPVLGAPGCARSPSENGFDWVLERLCAGVPLQSEDIAAMALGGLLMEIVSRPQPRAGETAQEGGEGVRVLVLAAGRSTRFGPENKLLAPFEGRTMLGQVVENCRAAGLEPLLVTGHEAEAIRAALPGVEAVHNPDYAEGMASSLRAGIAALPESLGAALVLLGDMPRVKPSTLGALMAAARRAPAAQAVVPAYAGRRGNPVLLRRSLFASLMRLHGDVGARKLLEGAGDAVLVLEVDDPGILVDFDTPQAMAGA